MARYDPLGTRNKVASKRQENQIVEAFVSRVHVPGSMAENVGETVGHCLRAVWL